MEQESSNAALRKTAEETARELSHLFMVYVANVSLPCRDTAAVR
jgi:hypothetical protein